MIPVEVKDVLMILSQTPQVIDDLVRHLDDRWLHAKEGPDTWTLHEVVAHLIFGEQTDWIPRIQIIMGEGDDKNFIPFDRSGHFSIAAGRTIESLLHQFAGLRKENLHILASMDITEDDLRKTGVHPAFGEVTLSQLLAAWVTHDMTHLAQLSRVIAKQYEEGVGPWRAYMRVLNEG